MPRDRRAKEATRWIPGAAGGMKDLFASENNPGVAQSLPTISESIAQRQEAALSALDLVVFKQETRTKHE